MAEAQPNQQQQGQFQLQRIYLKDLSYEAPKTPDMFRLDWKPDVNLEVNASSAIVEGEVHEVVLKVTITVKNQDKVAFLIELQQAGLFTISGFEGMQLEHITKGLCPNILFPYARETVSDLVARGTFPQFLLQPINFEGAFLEQMRQQQAQAGGEAPAPN